MSATPRRNADAVAPAPAPRRRGRTVKRALAVTGPAAAIAGHKDVCATLDRMTGAWARGDAYGAEYTADATYTSFVGSHYQGRADLTEGHRALFKGFLKGAKLADSYLGVRFHDPATVPAAEK